MSGFFRSRHYCNVQTQSRDPTDVLKAKNHSANCNILRCTTQEEMSTELRTEYEYSPLEADHIRLLYLQPGTADGPLKGHLEHIALTQMRHFAISYAWGPRVFDKVIPPGDRLLGITEFLHSALRAQRNAPTKIRAPLWADAICINQSSDERGAHKLPLWLTFSAWLLAWKCGLGMLPAPMRFRSG